MIDWTLDSRVYELRLKSPPCNEIGTEMVAALECFLDSLDPSKAHALIIHSELSNGFCAGGDLKELYYKMVSVEDSEQLLSMRSFLDRIHTVMNRIDSLPMTTIGVIHGICFGGGFELALTCDILVADRTARFCFPELRLGILPGFGGIPRLKREVPNPVARDLLMTGRSINVKKAAAIGLVSHMVNTGEALSVARQIAGQTTLFNKEAAVTTKAFVKPIPYEELEQEKEHFLQLFRNPSVKDALSQFVHGDDLMPYLPQAPDQNR